MKRKTLHMTLGEPAEWYRGTYNGSYLEHMVRKFPKWRHQLQVKGTVTYCGLRVHTTDKLGDPEQATCPTCKALYALELLANT